MPTILKLLLFSFVWIKFQLSARVKHIYKRYKNKNGKFIGVFSDAYETFSVIKITKGIGLILYLISRKP